MGLVINASVDYEYIDVGKFIPHHTIGTLYLIQPEINLHANKVFGGKEDQNEGFYAPV